MLYTVYKTTNLVNGKCYVGAHQTLDPDDAYIGSGFLIRRAIRKYGVEAFRKEVLFTFDNPKQMFEKEREIVTADFVARSDTYNIIPGGDGGWGHLNSDSDVQRAKALKSNARQRVIAMENPAHYHHRNQVSRENIRKAHWEGRDYATFTGRKHSVETKSKMSGPRPNTVGERNSQYGTVWVTMAGHPPKKIPSSELGHHLSCGWQRGRKG